MRYAIYFSPAKDDPLTHAAARWLGRDAYAGHDFAPPTDIAFAQDEWFSLTAEPRRYAFHATLKAPFTLVEGRNEADLLASVDAFAARAASFDIPPLAVTALGPFFALVPEAPSQNLQDFAANIVEHFEPFREALSDTDIARRKPETLTERQRDYLHRYGYPYVMEDFRFHMTLTGPVPEERRKAVHALLAERFSDFTGKPCGVDALTVFVEPQRGAPFHVLHRAPLTGQQNRRIYG